MTATHVVVTGEQQEQPVDTETERLLIPINDTCAALGGIGRTSVYELVKRGELTKVSIGRRGFITAKSIAAYVDRISEAASA